ncbi:hypothetical protein [Macrococcus armenti]|uniref:hypothetical protein n=1 Tax=Macrococcus armenti TaxID=2875764 RepID=UPI001CCF7F16|nr:hypothetical protein [Macrococcus armenti]UBH09793.1 hypothetical protein LAU41_11880 [Macrococcus armenti]
MIYERMLMFSPSSDYESSDVVGNLIYKDSLLNNVSSIPVLKKDLDKNFYPYQTDSTTDKNIDSYKTVLLTDPTNFDGIENTIDLSIYFHTPKNLKDSSDNFGYKKLVRGIENQEIVKFDEDDFTYVGSSLNNFDIAKEFIDYLRDTEFQYDLPKKQLDQANLNENGIEYIVKYSKNDEHIYINDFPCLPVENNKIKLINENYLDIDDPTINFENYLNSFDDYFVYVDLDKYIDESGNFVKNLIEDISPSELLKDYFKISSIERYEVSKVRYFESLISELDSKAKINNYHDSDIFNKIKSDYSRNIGKLLRSTGNNMSFFEYEGPDNFTKSKDNFRYALNSLDSLDEELISKKLLSQKDFNECRLFIDETTNDFYNLRAQYNHFLEEIEKDQAVKDLDRLKVDSYNGNISEEFYQGYKKGIILMNPQLEEEINSKEKKLEIVSDFKKIVDEDYKDVYCEFNFGREFLQINKHYYDYDFFNKNNMDKIENLFEELNPKSLSDDYGLDL